MMEDLEKDIETALNANVDLTTEEYVSLSKKMDESTKSHGVKGKAPVSESTRHKRVQTNFYSTATNIFINMYQVMLESQKVLFAMYDEIKELRNGRKGKDE